MKSVIIAYEPVWAIGTGNNATPHDAQQVHEYIRSLIREMYNNDIAENARIIYGGSMKPENSRQLMLEKDIDGGLIGGASLDPESFRKILDY
jgi:triosephosphate isomerase